MGVPAEHLNTSDSLEVSVMSPDEPTTGDTDRYCDFCHVEMKPMRELTLNEVQHTVLQCPSDPSHTKNVPA
jgi:hypothetical protein